MLRVDEAAFNRKMAGGGQLSLFQQKSYRQIVAEKRAALDAYRHASSFTEDLGALRETIQQRRCDDYALLNELLVDEFARLEIKVEPVEWDEKKKEERKGRKRAVQMADIAALQPFHWGYEFDEVMNERGGFDVIVTNPPWDIFKPNAKEFFAEYSDLVTKKNMDIKAFEAEQGKLLEQAEVRAAWLEYLSRFPHVSAYYRSAPQFVNQISIVNGKKAGSDINLYKLFVEQCFNLLCKDGLSGMIVPSGVYTDLGTKQLREMLFSKSQIKAILGLSNERFIFEGVHHAFKFALLTFQKGYNTTFFDGVFRINPREAVSPEQLDSFLADSGNRLSISADLMRKLAPDSFSVMEFRDETDVKIAEKMLKFPLLGEEKENTWQFRLTAEFHMTNDSHLFSSQKTLMSLPLYEGKMVWQFEHQYSEPRYWVIEADARKALLGKVIDQKQKLDYQNYRLGLRAVAASTNERSMICSVVPQNVFCGNSLLVNTGGFDNNASLLFCVAVLNSYVIDWLLRIKVSQNINMFYVYQLPVPRLDAGDPAFAPIVERAAKLICTTPEFDELLKDLSGFENLKGLTGVTDPAARAQLRAELDGMIAHLYGLTESELAHILSTFPLVGDDVKAGVMREFVRLRAGGGSLNPVK